MSAAALPAVARWIGLAASLVSLAIGVGLAAAFDTRADFQFAESYE